MSRIHKLNDALANQIAAGEVVERPASIIKELVENSLDAHAKNIQVHIEEGGLSKIQVIDDGDGFSPDDCELAFERHATSKIHTERDLFHIKTLGFRGEALPSIASVSHVDLKTSNGTDPGRRVVLQGGHPIQSTYASSRKGTDITIQNLFYNTPARLKHLKTVHTELGKITDIMNKLALAHPDIKFGLTHNGKSLFTTNGQNDLAQVLAAIYGVQTAKKSIAFTTESLDFSVSGRLVKPEVTRAGRQYVYIFINGRYIRSYPIFNAIMNGYHTLLPIGRYPIAMIHITMDPGLIDVNVHPAKLEARISKEQALCQLVEQGIKDAFHELRLIPAFGHQQPKRPKQVSEQTNMDFRDGGGGQVPEPVNHTQSAHQAYDPSIPERTSTQIYENTTDFEQVKVEEGLTDADDFPSSPLEETDPGDEPESRENHHERMPELHVIGQLHGTYILAQNHEGLYMIDQHAAQERIKYEFFREKVGETEHDIQELLVPMTFEFTPAEYTVIEQHVDDLESLGIHIQPFGQHSLIVTSHPSWFPKGEEKETIEDLVNQLLENESISIKKLREDLAIMMSCKRSIKANRYLNDQEINALLTQLGQAKEPFTCPHGRPVIVHFSTYDMEKLFKRVM
ncbi:DNA mismatch repair endonuclease MutL [Tuberibacillus sp. Marseille-P3662]|uniref:DNA mismatch repair endonuclease MutL n=1 Tax=Tuberibacillus sp. Marseille-P3662 TaxID=1965358 RepID=UPI000A1CC5C1|nr:DNA mismatch repair endonuclease MutL [Tuberibacillus sp. Marseille-P3662]